MKQRDPFAEPFCRSEDLGLAIPDSEHAVSVCLPRWEDVVGYEENEDRVIEALECGYPRFVEHPLITELFLAAQQEFAKRNEACLVFPSLSAAWRAAEFVKEQGGGETRLESYGWEQLTVLLVPEKGYGVAWKAWQHMGEIVSSRLADAALTDAPLPDGAAEAGSRAAAIVKERIAQRYSEASRSDVFLFSSGMAAISAIHRSVLRLHPELPTIQLEFPYIDALKLQEKCNPAGAVDFSLTGSGNSSLATDFLKQGKKAAALFSEIPSNPLLRTANLREVAPLLRENEIPLILDDTVATSVLTDAFRFADAVTTSLTKAFSGEGDVAAGSVVLNPASRFYESFHRELKEEEETGSPLFSLDALVLEVNSRHFEERCRAMNENASELIEFLSDHPSVEQMWHPSTTTRANYEEVMREDRGFGSLFSMKLKGGVEAASRFYDRIELSKGPGLGTNFSLVCPYALLAHYDELDWAESCGVPRDLIRVSVGLEEPDELLKRYESALS